MKIVLGWLREFCATDIGADELADRLTAAGVKVEDILRPWDGLEGVTVAKVLDVAGHPDSEKLCVTRIDAGGGAERQVVAGVRNMKAGDLVPLAPPGARVPALDEPLQARVLRGVESDGMLCSPGELAIADVHTGILVFAPETATLGADVKRLLGLDGEVVFDIEIEPNRPDLMSVIGVAREAAAATGVPLVVPATSLEEASEKATDSASVEIRDFERCSNYKARVIRGVSGGESPLSVQARLSASGMRPISGVVDATNYALLEIGHPLHPFDLALLEGSAIVVRAAADAETLTTLDGVERELIGEDLVIADAAKGVAIAGVMGSAAAEVSEATRDVLLESAYFEKTGVLRTARRLGLSTEASTRFERGADPEAVARAADRAAQLIVEWSGGAVLAGAAEAGSVPPRRTVAVRPGRASMLIGEAGIAASDIVTRLGTVDIATSEGHDAVEAEIPGFRVDILHEVDLIEEVARLGPGYAAVAESLPPVRQPGGFPAEYALRRRIAGLLVRAGIRETRSPSFASQTDLELFGDQNAVRVANPLADDEAWLRTRLTPGLLRALGRNASRSNRTAALFEIGTVFRLAADGADGGPIEERRKVGIALTGPATSGWWDPARELDFFDTKGVLEALLAGLGIEDWSLEGVPGEPFHPARSANISIADAPAGVIGEIHPRVSSELFDIPGRAAVVVLGVGPLLAHGNAEVVYEDMTRFPPSRRDLAFIVDDEVPAGSLLLAIGEAGGDLAGHVVLFDAFRGDPVPAGRKSLAFSVDFRAPDRTLTDEETDGLVAAIAERLASDFNAELRAG